MQCITSFDKNGRNEADTGLVFVDVWDMPGTMFGSPASKKGEPFYRVPADIAEKTNDGVKVLAPHTSGIRFLFETDSQKVALRVSRQEKTIPSQNFSAIGHSGFDMWEIVDGKYRAIDFLVNPGSESPFLGVHTFPEEGKHRIMLYFPLYNSVDSLEIGIEEGKDAWAVASPYKDVKPVLYYGSSITQGGCASRAGNAYQAMISRIFGLDFINLGFSGSAKGETIMVDWLAGYDPSVFVCDFDHNAPTPEFLEEVHYPLYERYRAARPNVPILFVSKPDPDLDPNADRRREIIRATYEKARAAGDDKVYFLDGASFFGEYERFACTVDGCHPNDLGFLRMAEGIGRAVTDILGL
ncbi:MAG: hypothetical protein IJB51_00745 [Clostridia bacterium]|nr:hypothetical protein [Clostridia bacterium]